MAKKAKLGKSKTDTKFGKDLIASARQAKAHKKLTDEERHKRFVAMGDEVGASKDPKDFEKAFKKVTVQQPLASKERKNAP